MLLAGLALLCGVVHCSAQTPGEVLVVVNRQSTNSREIGNYYMRKRAIPAENLCVINTAPVEMIERSVYDKEVEAQVGACLKKARLTEKVLYIVTTSGVPLRIAGDSAGVQNTASSVDSELTLLYGRLHGATYPVAGWLPNPFYRQRDTPFRHPLFPMYLVTRLAAWDLDEMKGLVDRALAARNTGKFVIDLRADENTEGNQWLRTAALLLPKERVVLEQTGKIAMNEKDVIGYASWGSNDPDRKQRFLHLQWLPGAIMTEFVSTNARTFRKPPDAWQIGKWSDNEATMFDRSPQTVTSDYIHEGATGASGHVDEPYLMNCPRPEFVLPAYYSGRTLAESYYMGIPALSWMNVVIGDPLTRLR